MNGPGLRILVPLDGSELSAWTLDRAAALFRTPGAEVVLLEVIQPPAGTLDDLAYRIDPRHAEVQARLVEARDRLRADGVICVGEIRFGHPAEAILREIREGAYSLVAMSTHGRSGLSRLLFGSVALRVLQGSTSPLLMYRPLQRPDGTLSPVETHEPTRFRRVLALLDGSPLAEEVLGPASDLARRFDGEIRFLTAVPGGPEEDVHRAAATERLEAWSRRLQAGRLRTSFVVRGGTAAVEALDEARAWGADVIALSTHGRTGAARAIYGSVAERILRDAPVPLLVVRNRSLAAAVPAGTEDGPVVRLT